MPALSMLTGFEPSNLPTPCYERLDLMAIAVDQVDREPTVPFVAHFENVQALFELNELRHTEGIAVEAAWDRLTFDRTRLANGNRPLTVGRYVQQVLAPLGNREPRCPSNAPI